MSRYRRRIGPQRANRKIRARTLQALIDDHNDRQRRVGPSTQVRRRAAGPAPITVRRLEVRALSTFDDAPADWLECVEPDNPDSQIYFVAKPLGVRPSRTSHGSVTFAYADSNTRTATLDGTSEDQTLVEPYIVGDRIMAASPILGGTGVVKDGAQLLWQEMPSTPRWWAVSDA
jgi:hypothetical protein